MELYEASQYGLLERIPVLLTSVSVDAVDAVSMSDFPISDVDEWFIARASPDLYVQLMNVHMVINDCRWSLYVTIHLWCRLTCSSLA